MLIPFLDMILLLDFHGATRLEITGRALSNGCCFGTICLPVNIPLGKCFLFKLQLIFLS